MIEKKDSMNLKYDKKDEVDQIPAPLLANTYFIPFSPTNRQANSKVFEKKISAVLSYFHSFAMQSSQEYLISSFPLHCPLKTRYFCRMHRSKISLSVCIARTVPHKRTPPSIQYCAQQISSFDGFCHVCTIISLSLSPHEIFSLYRSAYPPALTNSIRRSLCKTTSPEGSCYRMQSIFHSNPRSRPENRACEERESRQMYRS